MSSTSNLGQSKERIGFVIFAGLIVSLVWLTHSGASNSIRSISKSPWVQNKKQPPPCPSCPPPSPRRIYAPAIDLNEAQSCEIVLNSRSANPIDVTPTFYTASGDAIVGYPIQLQPAEIRFVPVERLMPESIRGTHRWGGIALSYTGNVLEVWAQITFHGIGGGSIDETFNILEEPGSDTREAVWWMPQHSTAIVALGNTSGNAVRANVQFSPDESEDVEIPAGKTKFVRRHAEGNQAKMESVKIVTADAAGAVRVAGFIVGDHDDFASSIRFYDTKKTIQPNLYAINLRLKHTMPRIVLKNTSDAPVTAHPCFFTAKGEQDNPVELSSLTLQPQQIVDLDLSALRVAAALRTDLDSVGVRIENSGAPGTLIGAAYSTDADTGMTYDVPLRDTGKIRNSTGSYPWRINNDYTSIVSITNAGSQPARFLAEIRYPGGPYSIKPQELKVGQTVYFDLRKIRDEQQPDRLGKTLPADVDHGQFYWGVVATPGESHIIGRNEVVSRGGRVVSSYSCPVCCPPGGPYGGFSPGAYGLYIDGIAATTSSGDYVDCYWNTTTSSVWWNSLSTWDSNIATFNSGTENLYGQGAGFTYAVGTYDLIYYDNDGMDCYQRWEQPTDYANVDVTPHIDDIQPALGPVGSSVGVSIGGKGFGNNPTVNVAGGGITASIQDHSDVSISVTLTIATDAAGGNHGVTVTVNGKQSNSVDFYVQIPTKLRRDSVGDLEDQQGGCGTTRLLRYTLLDQESEGAPISTSATIAEVIENESSTAGVGCTASDPQPLDHGGFGDRVGYRSPGCPPAFTTTCTQKFKVTLGGQTYNLSSQNQISMGRTSSGSKFVDLTFSQ